MCCICLGILELCFKNIRYNILSRAVRLSHFFISSQKQRNKTLQTTIKFFCKFANKLPIMSFIIFILILIVGRCIYLYTGDILAFLMKVVIFILITPFAPFVWCIKNWNKKRGYAVAILIIQSLAALIWIFIATMEITQSLLKGQGGQTLMFIQIPL